MTVDQAMQTAVQHHQAGRLAEAEHLYRRVLSSAPNHPDALHLLGMLARRAGQLDAAADLIRRSIAVNPQSPDFHSNLGLVLMQQSMLPEAIGEFREAISLRPQFAQAYCNLGSALLEQREWESATKAFESAVNINPQFAEAHSNLSSALVGLKQFDGAIAAATAAVALQPQSDDLNYNLGLVLHKANRLDAAAAAFSKAVEINPRHLKAICGIGNVRRDQGRQPEAIAYYQRAIEADPQHVQAHWNLGLTCLLLGEFETGWAGHEWRMQCETLSRPAMFKQPWWQGEPLEGRTILLHAEQGLGDTLQFVRYVPLVAERGGRVILQCQRELHRLLKNLPGTTEVFSQDQPLPEFELHCPLMSLPFVFQTRLDSIPAKVPYLSADPALEAAWKSKLTGAEIRRVGIVWAGSATHLNDHNRSIPLAMLAPLFNLKNMQWFSLQMGAAAGQNTALNRPLIDHTAEWKDFADSAALVANLDLVITVDTSVAHLAGAMGKPVWVMLPYDPDWRWLLDRDDSPWYPTMKLIRQDKPGDWATVVDKILELLCD